MGPSSPRRGAFEIDGVIDPSPERDTHNHPPLPPPFPSPFSCLSVRFPLYVAHAHRRSPLSFASFLAQGFNYLL